MVLPSFPAGSLAFVPTMLRHELGLSADSFIKVIAGSAEDGRRVSIYRGDGVTELVRVEERVDGAGNVHVELTDGLRIVAATSEPERSTPMTWGARRIGKGMFVVELPSWAVQSGSDPLVGFKQMAAEAGIPLLFADWSRFAFLPPDEHPGIERACPDREQWSLASGGQFNAGIDLGPSQSQTTGSGNVIVAVIDSGIRRGHREFSGATILPDENLLNPGAGLADNLSHGTACAGVIFAQQNPHLVGVAPGCTLLSIKVFDHQHVTRTCVVAEAINRAAERGARIVSISWQLREDCPEVRHAMEVNREMLFVTAAGIGPFDLSVHSIYPASYALSNQITVAGYDVGGIRGHVSNFDSTGNRVHIGAPGFGVCCCDGSSDGGYRPGNGSSYAAPHVAGVCALAWSAAPRATAAQIRDSVISTSVPLRGLENSCFRNGRVDAEAAVNDSVRRWAGDGAGTYNI